jgi:hypothetical protein
MPVPLKTAGQLVTNRMIGPQHTTGQLQPTEGGLPFQRKLLASGNMQSTGGIEHPLPPGDPGHPSGGEFQQGLDFKVGNIQR